MSGMPGMMGACMNMCKEMLEAVRETNALAVFSTPELRELFTEWLSFLEEKTLAALKEKGELEPERLGKILSVNAESALYLLMRLAKEGKISLMASAAK